MYDALIIIGACLIAEAFCSGGELALIAADKVRLRHLAEQRGGRRGAQILRFLEDPGELISTALTGTNICVVLSTVTATVWLLRVYPQQAELISLAVMTPLVLVVGEIVPKSVFQQYADRVAPALISALSVLRIAFWPVVALGSQLSGVLMRALHIERSRAAMTRDELRLLMKLPSRPGVNRITAEEKAMISRLFDFSATTVGHVMVPLSEVTALPTSATVEDVAGEIADKGHTRLPIYNDRVDQIEGIVHGFDALRAESGAPVTSFCRQALFVPENQPAVDTMVLMQREGQHMVVVVDEYGGAVGVVTIEDILEEIVGEIRDEYDTREGEAQIRREKGGAYRVAGRAAVADVNAVAGLHLPVADDYESVAGLVLDRLKRIPQPGESVEIGGVKLRIVAATDRSVDEVLIQPAKSARRERERVSTKPGAKPRSE